MDRFTGPIPDPRHLCCRPVAAGAKRTRRVDPGLPKNYSSLIAESSDAMISINAGNVPRLWPARYCLLELYGVATFKLAVEVWPPLGSVVPSASTM